METPWKLPPFYRLAITPEPGDSLVLAEDQTWWFVPADDAKVPTLMPQPGRL